VVGWWDRQQRLGALSERQLFFVGGAPRHRDTPRQYECSRLITADQATIRRIPGFLGAR
jgi:hypothetical protein